MATSRPLRDGDFVISLRGGGWATWHGQDRDSYVLGSDFGLPEWQYDYWVRVCERIYGLAIDSNVSIAAAITNGTAPGLYVREGDDTSDWEVYREVLARRVEEAMAARRGEASGGETATAETATTRQDDEMRPPSGGIAAIADVRKVSSPPQTVAANISPMPDGEVARIEAAVSDEVRRRISSPLASSSDETTIRRVVNPVPPTAGVYIGPATIRFDDRAFTGIITATGPLRRGELPVSSLPTAASPPSPPSRFSLLEVDGDTDTAPAPTPQATKASTGLAALQKELRAEREAKRALAAAQTPPGRFDLLECDLPVPASKPAKAPQQRPAASSPPPRRPVETITDLTAARSPLELARMLEGLNDELSTMIRQREAN